MKFSKIIVTVTLRSGEKIKFKCRDIEIKKNGDELVGYSIDGLSQYLGDPLYYLKLDSIDHISYRRAFW